jgi:hypothetical protein
MYSNCCALALRTFDITLPEIPKQTTKTACYV